MALQTFPTTIEPSVDGTSKVTKTRVKRTQYGDGYSQRSTDGINYVIQEWQLSWVGESNIITTMEAFLEARGGVEAFYWTPKRSTSQKIYTCQEWTRSFRSDSIDVLTATFTEEFDLL